MSNRPNEQVNRESTKCVWVDATREDKNSCMNEDANHSKPHILIVDDEEEIRWLMKAMVNRFGYDATTAAGGEEAFSLVEKEPFDLVITDILMPDISGLELIERIHTSHPEIDLIAVTGHDVAYRYTDVIKVGASDFITKPVDVNELQAKILRVFRERKLRFELQRLTRRDDLTDLYNRRYFNQRGIEEVSRALRQGYPLYLVLIDIDRFKWYNDRFGHQAGDMLLKKLAATINALVRSGVDTTFRYGGDEFGILVPHVSVDQAQVVAERIRCKYRQVVDHDTSLSLGLASLEHSGLGHENDLRLLIQHADEALYGSKEKGGDRVTVYAKEDET